MITEGYYSVLNGTLLAKRILEEINQFQNDTVPNLLEEFLGLLTVTTKTTKYQLPRTTLVPIYSSSHPQSAIPANTPPAIEMSEMCRAHAQVPEALLQNRR